MIFCPLARGLLILCLHLSDDRPPQSLFAAQKFAGLVWCQVTRIRAEHMKALRGNVDAAVVGSAIVDEIDRGGDPVALVKELLKGCR